MFPSTRKKEKCMFRICRRAGLQLVRRAREGLHELRRLVLLEHLDLRLHGLLVPARRSGSAYPSPTNNQSTKNRNVPGDLCTERGANLTGHVLGNSKKIRILQLSSPPLNATGFTYGCTATNPRFYLADEGRREERKKPECRDTRVQLPTTSTTFATRGIQESEN